MQDMNICVIGISEEEKRDEDNIWKDMVANFSKPDGRHQPEIQESLPTPRRINTNKLYIEKHS